MNQSPYEETHTLLYIRACEKMKSRLANTVSEAFAAGSTKLYRHGRTTLQTNDYKVQRNKSKDRTHIRFSEAA